ncbi:hypothetical protein NKG05_28030 [Oerskovia sp. M15]
MAVLGILLGFVTSTATVDLRAPQGRPSWRAGSSRTRSRAAGMTSTTSPPGPRRSARRPRRCRPRRWPTSTPRSWSPSGSTASRTARSL